MKTEAASLKRVDYRKLAFATYPPVCAHCGFGAPDVLEVCHVDCDRANNAVANLVILCPTCHKMHDLDLISTDTICTMRDRPKKVRWAKRMKDAGIKAATSRRSHEVIRRLKRRMAVIKAATRKRNLAGAEIKQPETRP